MDAKRALLKLDVSEIDDEVKLLESADGSSKHVANIDIQDLSDLNLMSHACIKALKGLIDEKILISNATKNRSTPSSGGSDQNSDPSSRNGALAATKLPSGNETNTHDAGNQKYINRINVISRQLLKLRSELKNIAFIKNGIVECATSVHKRSRGSRQSNKSSRLLTLQRNQAAMVSILERITDLTLKLESTRSPRDGDSDTNVSKVLNQSRSRVANKIDNLDKDIAQLASTSNPSDNADQQRLSKLLAKKNDQIAELKNRTETLIERIAEDAEASKKMKDDLKRDNVGDREIMTKFQNLKTQSESHLAQTQKLISKLDKLIVVSANSAQSRDMSGDDMGADHTEMSGKPLSDPDEALSVLSKRVDRLKDLMSVNLQSVNSLKHQISQNDSDWVSFYRELIRALGQDDDPSLTSIGADDKSRAIEMVTRSRNDLISSIKDVNHIRDTAYDNIRDIDERLSRISDMLRNSDGSSRGQGVPIPSPGDPQPNTIGGAPGDAENLSRATKPTPLPESENITESDIGDDDGYSITMAALRNKIEIIEDQLQSFLSKRNILAVETAAARKRLFENRKILTETFQVFRKGISSRIDHLYTVIADEMSNLQMKRDKWERLSKQPNERGARSLAAIVFEDFYSSYVELMRKLIQFYSETKAYISLLTEAHPVFTSFPQDEQKLQEQKRLFIVLTNQLSMNEVPIDSLDGLSAEFTSIVSQLADIKQQVSKTIANSEAAPIAVDALVSPALSEHSDGNPRPTLRSAEDTEAIAKLSAKIDFLKDALKANTDQANEGTSQLKDSLQAIYDKDNIDNQLRLELSRHVGDLVGASDPKALDKLDDLKAMVSNESSQINDLIRQNDELRRNMITKLNDLDPQIEQRVVQSLGPQFQDIDRRMGDVERDAHMKLMNSESRYHDAMSVDPTSQSATTQFLHDVQNSNDEWRRRYDDLKAHYGELKDAYEDATTGVSFQSKLLPTVSANDAQESLVLKSQLGDWEHRLATVLHYYKQLEEHAFRLKAELDASTAQYEDLQMDVTRRSARDKKYQQLYESLESETAVILSEKESEINQIKEKYVAAVRKLTEVNVKNISLDAENKSLEQKISTIQEKLESFLEQINNQKLDIAKFEQEAIFSKRAITSIGMAMSELAGVESLDPDRPFKFASASDPQSILQLVRDIITDYSWMRNGYDKVVMNLRNNIVDIVHTLTGSNTIDLGEIDERVAELTSEDDTKAQLAAYKNLVLSQMRAEADRKMEEARLLSRLYGKQKIKGKDEDEDENYIKLLTKVSKIFANRSSINYHKQKLALALEFIQNMKITHGDDVLKVGESANPSAPGLKPGGPGLKPGGPGLKPGGPDKNLEDIENILREKLINIKKNMLSFYIPAVRYYLSQSSELRSEIQNIRDEIKKDHEYIQEKGNLLPYLQKTDGILKQLNGSWNIFDQSIILILEGGKPDKNLGYIEDWSEKLFKKAGRYIIEGKRPSELLEYPDFPLSVAEHPLDPGSDADEHIDPRFLSDPVNKLWEEINRLLKIISNHGRESSPAPDPLSITLLPFGIQTSDIGSETSTKRLSALTKFLKAYAQWSKRSSLTPYAELGDDMIAKKESLVQILDDFFQRVQWRYLSSGNITNPADDFANWFGPGSLSVPEGTYKFDASDIRVYLVQTIKQLLAGKPVQKGGSFSPLTVYGSVNDIQELAKSLDPIEMENNEMRSRPSGDQAVDNRLHHLLHIIEDNLNSMRHQKTRLLRNRKRSSRRMKSSKRMSGGDSVFRREPDKIDASLINPYDVNRLNEVLEGVNKMIRIEMKELKESRSASEEGKILKARLLKLEDLLQEQNNLTTYLREFLELCVDRALDLEGELAKRDDIFEKLKKLVMGIRDNRYNADFDIMSQLPPRADGSDLFPRPPRQLTLKNAEEPFRSRAILAWFEDHKDQISVTAVISAVDYVMDLLKIVDLSSKDLRIEKDMIDMLKQLRQKLRQTDDRFRIVASPEVVGRIDDLKAIGMKWRGRFGTSQIKADMTKGLEDLLKLTINPEGRAPAEKNDIDSIGKKLLSDLRHTLGQIPASYNSGEVTIDDLRTKVDSLIDKLKSQDSIFSEDSQRVLFGCLDFVTFDETASDAPSDPPPEILKYDPNISGFGNEYLTSSTMQANQYIWHLSNIRINSVINANNYLKQKIIRSEISAMSRIVQASILCNILKDLSRLIEEFKIGGDFYRSIGPFIKDSFTMIPFSKLSKIQADDPVSPNLVQDAYRFLRDAQSLWNQVDNVTNSSTNGKKVFSEFKSECGLFFKKHVLNSGLNYIQKIVNQKSSTQTGGGDDSEDPDVEDINANPDEHDSSQEIVRDSFRTFFVNLDRALGAKGDDDRVLLEGDPDNLQIAAAANASSLVSRIAAMSDLSLVVLNNKSIQIARKIADFAKLNADSLTNSDMSTVRVAGLALEFVSGMISIQRQLLSERSFNERRTSEATQQHADEVEQVVKRLTECTHNKEMIKQERDSVVFNKNLQELNQVSRPTWFVAVIKRDAVEEEKIGKDSASPSNEKVLPESHNEFSKYDDSSAQSDTAIDGNESQTSRISESPGKILNEEPIRGGKSENVNNRHSRGRPLPIDVMDIIKMLRLNYDSMIAADDRIHSKEAQTIGKAISTVESFGGSTHLTEKGISLLSEICRGLDERIARLLQPYKRIGIACGDHRGDLSNKIGLEDKECNSLVLHISQCFLNPPTSTMLGDKDYARKLQLMGVPHDVLNNFLQSLFVRVPANKIARDLKDDTLMQLRELSRKSKKNIIDACGDCCLANGLTSSEEDTDSFYIRVDDFLHIAQESSVDPEFIKSFIQEGPHRISKIADMAIIFGSQMKFKSIEFWDTPMILQRENQGNHGISIASVAMDATRYDPQISKMNADRIIRAVSHIGQEAIVLVHPQMINSRIEDVITELISSGHETPDSLHITRFRISSTGETPASPTPIQCTFDSRTKQYTSLHAGDTTAARESSVEQDVVCELYCVSTTSQDVSGQCMIVQVDRCTPNTYPHAYLRPRLIFETIEDMNDLDPHKCSLNEPEVRNLLDAYQQIVDVSSDLKEIRAMSRPDPDTHSDVSREKIEDMMVKVIRLTSAIAAKDLESAFTSALVDISGDTQQTFSSALQACRSKTELPKIFGIDLASAPAETILDSLVKLQNQSRMKRLISVIDHKQVPEACLSLFLNAVFRQMYTTIVKTDIDDISTDLLNSLAGSRVDNPREIDETHPHQSMRSSTPPGLIEMISAHVRDKIVPSSVVFWSGRLTESIAKPSRRPLSSAENGELCLVDPALIMLQERKEKLRDKIISGRHGACDEIVDLARDEKALMSRNSLLHSIFVRNRVFGNMRDSLQVSLWSDSVHPADTANRIRQLLVPMGGTPSGHIFNPLDFSELVQMWEGADSGPFSKFLITSRNRPEINFQPLHV